MIFGVCCITHVDSFFCLPTWGFPFLRKDLFFTTFFGEALTLEFEEETGRYSSGVDSNSI